MARVTLFKSTQIVTGAIAKGTMYTGDSALHPYYLGQMEIFSLGSECGKGQKITQEISGHDGSDSTTHALLAEDTSERSHTNCGEG